MRDGADTKVLAPEGHGSDSALNPVLIYTENRVINCSAKPKKSPLSLKQLSFIFVHWKKLLPVSTLLHRTGLVLKRGLRSYKRGELYLIYVRIQYCNTVVVIVLGMVVEQK